MGYREHTCDSQLATTDELEGLLLSLQEAHESVDAGHRALTLSWGAPLSLFREEDGRGVPKWVSDVILRGCWLVGKASELEDLSDVYKAQLRLSMQQDRGILRDPILELTVKLDKLSECLAKHIAPMISASEAFKDPSLAPLSMPPFNCSALAKSTANSESEANPKSEGVIEEQDAVDVSELPISVLGDKRLLGELFAVTNSIESQYMDALARSWARKQQTQTVDQALPSFNERVKDFISAPLEALSEVSENVGSQYKDAVARRNKTYSPDQTISSFSRITKNTKEQIQRLREDPNWNGERFGSRMKQVFSNEAKQ